MKTIWQNENAEQAIMVNGNNITIRKRGPVVTVYNEGADVVEVQCISRGTPVLVLLAVPNSTVKAEPWVEFDSVSVRSITRPVAEQHELELMTDLEWEELLSLVEAAIDDRMESEPLERIKRKLEALRD